MRLFTDRRSLIACLLGALPFVLVACFTEARNWALTGLVVLGALVAFGFSSGDRRHPSLHDTERFLISWLVKQGFGGAFRVGDLEHRVSAGSAPDCVNVHFKATITITEPLYQTTVPPPEACGAFTPRRLAALGKIAGRLAEEIEHVPGTRMPVPPPDVYLRQYIHARSQQGWSLAIAGAARATYAPTEGWNYALTTAPREFERLAQTGRPRAAFANAVVLDASDGQQWLRDTLQAWARFEDDLNELRASIDQHRTRRGHDAVAAFFATHRAGTSFQGTGETVTQRIVPRPFWLEISALDAAQNRVQFTLRPGQNSPYARRFAATVDHEPDTGVVRLIAQTSAADVAPGGGPLLDAATAFTLEFIWERTGASQLTGQGADFVLTLREVTADALAGLRTHGLDREREIWNAVAPGTSYAGTFIADGREKRLLLMFVPAAEPGSLVARLESDGWSEIFSVARTSGQAADGEHDLILEAHAVPAPLGAADDGVGSPWQRVRLHVNGRELTGVIESAAGAFPVVLQH